MSQSNSQVRVVQEAVVDPYAVTPAELRLLGRLAAPHGSDERDDHVGGSLLGISATSSLLLNEIAGQARRQADQLTILAGTGISAKATVGLDPDATAAIAGAAATLVSGTVQPLLEPIGQALTRDRCDIDMLHGQVAQATQELHRTESRFGHAEGHLQRLDGQVTVLGREVRDLRDDMERLAAAEWRLLSERICALEEQVKHHGAAAGPPLHSKPHAKAR